MNQTGGPVNVSEIRTRRDMFKCEPLAAPAMSAGTCQIRQAQARSKDARGHKHELASSPCRDCAIGRAVVAQLEGQAPPIVVDAPPPPPPAAAAPRPTASVPVTPSVLAASTPCAWKGGCADRVGVIRLGEKKTVHPELRRFCPTHRRVLRQTAAARIANGVSDAAEAASMSEKRKRPARFESGRPVTVAPIAPTPPAEDAATAPTIPAPPGELPLEELEALSVIVHRALVAVARLGGLERAERLADALRAGA